MYPQKLASLDLDLAIAPLENNQFNDCKSNLRLLEYGACGYPVICSNSRAFTDSGLPVEIIKNRYKDWIDSIRAHISEINHLPQKGIQLKEQVTNKWMLEKESLKNWQSKWLN
jgi:hypothetical protein